MQAHAQCMFDHQPSSMTLVVRVSRAMNHQKTSV